MYSQNRREFLRDASIAAAAAAIAPHTLLAERMLPPPMPTFARFRPRLVDDPNPEQLVRAIVAFAQPSVTDRHTLGNGAHGVGPGSFGSDDGQKFFDWHHDYIGELEAVLGRPVPSWAPWEPIPSAFLQPAERARNVHQPDISPLAFTMYSNQNITQWNNIGDMGVSLSWGPHFATHFRTGGYMAVIARAAIAPIFWPWHAFVDDIGRNYRERKAKSPGTPKPPKSWPFPTREPPRPAVSGGDSVVLTPLVAGMLIGHARDKVREAGLRVRETRDFRDSDRVISQRPLPFAQQRSSDGIVEISPRLESSWPSI